ncbi:MAG: hypothetical protein H6865_00440 [Rhodospirillales bacterium]|nr:hypothetical protein [Alphaproteobacteria bacterium]MCB9986094.1 hypothetical protein [Rhodospirillales bacterium]USO07343.1 MAG: hypothetical protein H6866_07935 [Rhodospirillales bacterium]
MFNPLGPHAREFMALASGALSAVNVVVYLLSVWRGKTRPHMYSWIIWALVPAVVGAAQIASNGGVGGWSTLVSVLTAGIVALVAAFRGEKAITRGDRLCLAGCVVAILLWPLTRDPLASVVLITAIDLVGFYPSVRKSLHKPWEESASGYVLFGTRSFMVCAALTEWRLVSVVYPLLMGLACFVFAGFLALRRRAMGRAAG